jgi:hypothetical protein
LTKDLGKALRAKMLTADETRIAVNLARLPELQGLSKGKSETRDKSRRTSAGGFTLEHCLGWSNRGN